MRSAALFGVVLLVLLAVPAISQSLWDQLAEHIGLRGKPVPASANVLSEHEIAELDKMAPQEQATLLLERCINHYRGASDQIAKRVPGWQGKVYKSNPTRYDVSYRVDVQPSSNDWFNFRWIHTMIYLRVCQS